MKNLDMFLEDYKNLYEAACVYDANTDEFKSLMNQAISVGRIVADLEVQESKERIDHDNRVSREVLEVDSDPWWYKLIPDGNAIWKGAVCIAGIGLYIYCDKNGLLVPKPTNLMFNKLI